jgi:purine catabolism regulator
LHVHVNTLRYRLGKIQELLGVDLHDVDARFVLELALRVHAILE